MSDPTLWLLKGDGDAPGWVQLQVDSMAKKIYVLSFDRGKWALIKEPEAPEGYEGMTVSEPPDGVYLDADGRPIYVLNRREVHSAKVVVEALGEEAQKLLDKVGDPVMVLDRLGKSY